MVRQMSHFMFRMDKCGRHTSAVAGQTLGWTNVGRTNVGRTNVGQTNVHRTKVAAPFQLYLKIF